MTYLERIVVSTESLGFLFSEFLTDENVLICVFKASWVPPLKLGLTDIAVGMGFRTGDGVELLFTLCPCFTCSDGCTDVFTLRGDLNLVAEWYLSLSLGIVLASA